MALTPSTMYLGILIILFLWQVYSVYSTKNRIWCSFRRADRTKIEKWAKQNQKRIDFDGGWYLVEPDRTTLMIKWMPLPMWVRSLDFRHDSSRALHPDTFNNEYTPEERKQLDISDDVKAYEEGGRLAMQGKQKKGLLEGWMPIILIVGFIILGFLLWQQGKKLDMIGTGQNVIESELGRLLGK